MISAAVFDMDGVLIDSEPLWQEAQIELFGAIGVPLTRELCRQTRGLRIDQVVDHWYARFAWAGTTTSEMVTRVVDRMVVLVTTRGRLLSGARPALQMLAERGVALGLASSSYGAIVDAVVTSCGLEDVFECTVSGDMVARGKPDPSIYLEALGRLEASPQESVAIEDSIPGLASAKAAGMRCVAVPDAAADADAFSEADLILPSLVGLDTAAWTELESGTRR